MEPCHILRRALAALLAAAIVLAAPGCTPPADTGSGSTAAAAASATQTTSLSSTFKTTGADGALLRYTGDAMDGMEYPEFVLCDDGLLLYEAVYSESAVGTLQLALLDPATGTAVATAQLDCEFVTDVRQTEAGIMLCDSGLGVVTLLDDGLGIEQQWSLEADYEYWYAGADGASVYLVRDGAFLRADLAGGEVVTLLESSVSLYGGAPNAEGASISYVDEQTQLSVEAWLDLATGELTVPEFGAAVGAISCAGGTWLASLEESATSYLVGTEDDLQVIECAEGDPVLVQGSGYLLLEDDDAGTFSLYDASGAFAGSCSIGETGFWTYGSWCAYSERYGGTFLLVNTDGTPQLYFWDAAAGEGAGADLVGVALEEYEGVPAGSVVDAALYERASELGEAFGLEILIAEQCATEYSDFCAEQELDEELIGAALDTLEEALSAYPRGFFEQLRFDKVTGVRINICGTLTPTSEGWGGEAYNGLSEQSGGRYVVAFDAEQLYAETVYHEFSHVIDAKLAWDAYCREDALFSEEAWAALNPEDFEYAYEYSGWEELAFEGDEWEYFIDSYAMVSPTEDRARIMEYAMAGYDSYFTEFEPTYAKLRYYCACIRDAFDTAGWPETTTWEDVED